MSYLLNSTGYHVLNSDIVKGSGCYVEDSNGMSSYYNKEYD